jgi:hypothetical protein
MINNVFVTFLEQKMYQIQKGGEKIICTTILAIQKGKKQTNKQTSAAYLQVTTIRF